MLISLFGAGRTELPCNILSIPDQVIDNQFMNNIIGVVVYVSSSHREAQQAQHLQLDALFFPAYSEDAHGINLHLSRRGQNWNE